MGAWKTLEDEVRGISSYIWNAPAEPAKINDVKIDCLVKTRDDYWIVVEISKEHNLAKLRTDLAKFASVRPYLFSKNIYAECIFVCDVSPDASLIETGQGQNVQVLSVDQLRRKFFDFSAYFHSRINRPFGSAVDPKTGSKDNKKYINVFYVSGDDEVSISDLKEYLKQKQNIILLGEYGTGKSRCVQELFRLLSEDAKRGELYPISINLRDNWGMQSAEELIRRHFETLGLADTSDSLVRSFDKGGVCFLLDGFDEIGSQSWGDDQAKLANLRKRSVVSIKDLISKCPDGRVVVTGREHYFNSDDEMLKALGLSRENCKIVRCKDEFTIEEMEEFLSGISENTVLPSWLPRRPLMCQTISQLDEEDVERIFVDEGRGSEFWHRLIDVICEREARINPILDAETIKKVYQKIARATRAKPTDVGPITISELNQAFETVLGTPPIDESATMLQRLPGLGRTSTETSDRSFIDGFILDGLRALDVAEIVVSSEGGLEKEKWTNPLREVGYEVLAQWMSNSFSPYLSYARKAANNQNKIIAADIVASAMHMQKDTIDFNGIYLDGVNICCIDMKNTIPANITITDSIIETLKLPESKPEATYINSSVIGQVEGVSAATGLPKWCKNLDVDRFQAIHTVARIKAANLNNAQEIFVTIVKKTFFQPGAGRKEDALLRGLGRFDKKGNARKIINILMSERILTRFKGDEGWVYSPERSKTKKMSKILAELTLSKDELWKKISNL